MKIYERFDPMIFVKYSWMGIVTPTHNIFMVSHIMFSVRTKIRKVLNGQQFLYMIQ